MAEDRKDPYGAFNFTVELGGKSVGGFSEISGISSETDVVEYRAGSDKTTRKLPGLKKTTNITLKRGYTANVDLWDWRKKVLDGKTERRDGSINLIGEDRSTVVLTWDFTAGWPSKWEGPGFNAKNSEVAIESLEITCEDIELQAGG